MDKEKIQVSSPKAYDQVLEYLKTLIKNKEISYGGKIPSERELMETLGISRNSVREALRILVNRMGESLSSVFSMLVLMEESNYREVNQLRSILEKQAYVQACALITAEGKEKAGEIIHRMENGDLEERMRADHELHHLVFEYSQNRLLILLTDALSEIMRSEGEVVLRQAASIDTDEWITIHKNIATCLIEGNIQEGLFALEEHYEWLERDIKM